MRYICTAVVATLVLAGTSFAATINVPDDHATIQGAINASSDGDVIAIAAGTYYEHTLNPNGKAITIGSASGNLDVTIDAQGGGSVFVISSGETSGTVIKDLVITGGTGTANWGKTTYYGGGIYCYESSPTISGCTISGNTANQWGGGIWCHTSQPTISGCTISGNTADSGVGISCYLNSSPTISNCTISGNTAYNEGGGIACTYQSNPTISGCTISDNTADYGGGIYCYYSNPTISDCTISSNEASGPPGLAGGGMYISAIDYPTISNSLICGNQPDQVFGGYTDDGGNTVADECPLEGACCVGSSCSVGTEADCVSADGTYQGDYSDCSGNPCTPPAEGACCVISGCTALDDTQCSEMGGTWLGEGGSCDDCPASCMGDTDGNGVVNIEDLLNMMGSWGPCP